MIETTTHPVGNTTIGNLRVFPSEFRSVLKMLITKKQFVFLDTTVKNLKLNGIS